MANLYYDFGQVRGFVPYVGVGLGIARHDLERRVVHWRSRARSVRPIRRIRSADQIKTNFAWSLMAGVAYQISDRAILDFGYRYIDMGDVSTARQHL